MAKMEYWFRRPSSRLAEAIQYLLDNESERTRLVKQGGEKLKENFVECNHWKVIENLQRAVRLAGESACALSFESTFNLPVVAGSDSFV